jgi:cellulose synthase/poly-beta-1,6-N-acetylglucosamine synthase-like glycosyltransferase
LNSYLKKYGYRPRLIDADPPNELGIVVVIPSCNENSIEHTLNALYSCTRPDCAVEIITIINASEEADAEVLEANLSTYSICKMWELQHSEPQFRFYTICENALPARHAGVGLARKIGMDEAVDRFERIGNHKGIIACFDADSTCSSDYLTALLAHFETHPKSPGCSIQFRHPTFGTDFPPKNYLGIAYYELHLRYYNQALRASGFPHAYHTIGSAMAVRSDAYQKQGGMNRRQAGEDFYFLQKIIEMGHFTELNDTVVYPSPRPSHRVPFGTGRAISDYLKTADRGFYTYNLQAFKYLSTFFKNIPEFYLSGVKLVTLGGVIPYVMIDFLNAYFFDERIDEIRRNSNGFTSFEKRFYRWFNAFMVLKFVHFVRDNAHPNVRVEKAALEFLREVKYPKFNEIRSMDDLLEVFRALDRAPLPAQVQFYA